MSPREPNPLDDLPDSDEESSWCCSSLEEKEVRLSVSFGVVSVREYTRVVGDHPETRAGPPMALGNEYVQNDDVSLEDFEQQKPEERRSLRINGSTRKNMLVQVWGFTEEEVSWAEKEAQRIKRQRKRSFHQAKTDSLSPMMLQNFSRDKLLKNFSMAAAGGMGMRSFAIPA